jgi:hypothetical protein
MNLRLNKSNHTESVKKICVNALRAYEEVEFDLHLFLNLALDGEWLASLDVIVY